MTTKLTSSVTVSFKTDIDGVLVMEVDDRPDGLNGGGTTFYPGDSPGFLIYKSSAVSIYNIRATEGAVADLGSGSRVVTEWLTCAMDKRATTKYPVTGGLSVLQSKGDSITGYQVAEEGITFPTKLLAVVEVQYTTNFTAHRLTGASGVAPVIVFATGGTV